MNCAFLLAAVAGVAVGLPFRVEIPDPMLSSANSQAWKISPGVAARLRNMTLAEKTAQMNQMAIGEFLTDNQFDEAKARAILSADQIGSLFGSFTYETGSPTASEHRAVLANIQAIALEYGPTPILFAIDSVHGANFINGATIFPQQINVGASFNRALAREMGRITAKDTRAAAVLWDFAPILDLAFHPLFPRIYESFGEDPILVAELAAAMIEGLQGTGLLSDPSRVAACMKHFIAYGTSFTGHDRVPSTVSDRFLNQYHVPPFQRAIDVGVATAMEAYTEINGVPVVSSAQYLEVLLRENMKFQGTLVTDFSEIKNLVYFHRAASSEKSATKLSISQTSVDISMVPADTSFARYLTELVEDGEISESRIDQSVAHILQLKEDLGLFEDPFSESSIPLIPSLGQAEDRAVALRIAQESIVLSQNRRNVLPLRFEKNTEKRTERIVILGPASHSLRLQSGGWTIRWQGADNDEQFPFGVTLYDAFLSGFPETQFFTVCDASENSPINQTELELALLAVSECDVVIFAFAEEPYAEVLGHIKDPALPSSQRQLLDVVSAALPPPASPSRPAVLAVVFEGRPRLLTDVEAAVDAILVAWLPGPEGGQAVYDIIVGNVNPSARMPLTYHGNRAAYPLPYFHRFYEVSAAAGVQYEFGSGLSYSDFAYDSLTLNASIVTPSDRVEASVRVTNNGPYDGSHSILFYLRDLFRVVTPEMKLLKGFEKVTLAVGESVRVCLTLDATDLAFWGVDNTLVLEQGDFVLSVAQLTATFTLNLPDNAAIIPWDADLLRFRETTTRIC